MTQVDPAALLADVRRKKERTDEIARRARAKLGVRTTTMQRETRLSAEQRAAAERAKSGPLGWLFAGSSPEDVVRDSGTLKQIMRIYRARPGMRGASRTTIELTGGRSVMFDTKRGRVIRP